MATYEHTVTNCNPDIINGLGVYSFAWRLADGRITSVRAKLSSGTGTFNISESANGISATDSDEGIGTPLWHLMADDLGSPAGASDNDPISGWYSHTKNKNGVLSKFDAPDSGEEPLYRTSAGPGSSEALQFDGTDDILVMSAGVVTLDYDADFTAYVVLGDFTSGNQRPIIGNSDLSTSTGQSWNSMWGHKGGDLRVRNDSNEYNDGNSDLGTDELRVLRCENASTSRSLITEYVDGVAKYTDEEITISSSSGGWTFNAIGGMQRNRNGTTPPSEQNRLFKGSISEVILYEGALNTDQRQLIEGVLAHKYGLTLNAGHPWVSTNPFATSFAVASDIVLSSSYPVSGASTNISVSLGDTVSFYMPNLQNPGTLTVEVTYSFT